MILAAWYHIILAVIFAGVATFLMLIILLQRGKGVGLAGAFGGAGGPTVFGSKTGDILTWATVVVAGVFMLSAVLLNYVFVPQRSGLGLPAISAPAGTAQPMTPAEDEPEPAPAGATDSSAGSQAPAAAGTPEPAAAPEASPPAAGETAPPPQPATEPTP